MSSRYKPTIGRGWAAQPLRVPSVSRACDTQAPRAQRSITFVVGGQDFDVEKPLLALRSPSWKRKLEEDPGLVKVDLRGDAASFGVFVRYLRGAEGCDCEVSAENVLDLLHWAKEFDIPHVPRLCEELLLLRPPADFSSTTLLELAARYDMPLLYTKATEAVAHEIGAVDVPANISEVEHPFATREIREDVIRAHVSMGLMRSDAESRRRQRFADYAGLNDSQHRARIFWKTRHRFVKPPPEPEQIDWRTLQTCWPHDSFRGDDWVVVPAETQPTIPLRKGRIAAPSVGYAKTHRGRGEHSVARAIGSAIAGRASST